MRRIGASPYRRLRQTIASFLRDRRGNVALLLAFSAVPLVGAVGLAVDSSLAVLTKNRLQKSLDAAGLAAGRALFTNYVTADAQQFFDANFVEDNGVASVTAFDVTVDANEEFITLTASASMPTTFLHLFGFDALEVGARTVIHRENRGMELVLVMDNTGSMRSGGKIDAMKAAARELVEIVYGNDETLPDLWVGLVPYTATVNIGLGHWDWLDPADRFFDNPDPFDPADWKGCVEARPAPLDQDDTPPPLARFASYFYAADVDNEWPPIDETNAAKNNGTGPNLGCGPAITPLVAEKTTVLAAIDEMLPWHRGGTTGNLGLSWGWRALSPQWRGLWGGTTPPYLPLDYDDPLMEKVVVILTDGKNQFYDWPNHEPNHGVGPGGSDYTAYGRLNDFGFATLGAARQELDSRFAATCEQMKAQGILLYTITFGSTPDAATQNLYRACATTPDHYFHSPDSATLGSAFREIARELSNLRIAE
jgi:Flp pilus assembly protein TadG